MSLILRKLNFAADWRAVGRRCVVNPECCRTYNVSVCTNDCGWVLPDRLYVTVPDVFFLGLQPFLTPVSNVVFRCDLLPYSSLNVSDIAYGGAGTDPVSPVWGVNDVDLSGVIYEISEGGSFDPAPGPKHAQFIGRADSGFSNGIYMLVHATCFIRALCVPPTALPPTPDNLRLCVTIRFWFQHLLEGLPNTWYREHPVNNIPCLGSGVNGSYITGNIGRDSDGTCTPPQLPSDIEYFGTGEVITVS